MSKVLFLDDEEAILNTYKRMLYCSTVDGYFAKSIEEAEKIVAENQVDLIISDYRLRQETGLDFLNKLREKNHAMPMVIISGYAEENFIKEAMNSNVIQEYLIKPVNVDAFRTMISKYLLKEIV